MVQAKIKVQPAKTQSNTFANCTRQGHKQRVAFSARSKTMFSMKIWNKMSGTMTITATNKDRKTWINA
eukprot:5150595-Amphidinium_carterae.1